MSVTPQTNTTIEEIAERLRTLDSFALCGHVSPDGDCIGSALGLSHALRMLGKKTACLLAADALIEPGLRFLPGADELIYAGDYDETPDAFIALDVPTIERIEDAAAVHDRAGVRVTIDHHAVDTTMAELSYIDPDAPACGMLVWDLIRALGIEPPRESAICCYTALMTDTGRFQYQNTSAEAFRYAMEMVRCGANPAYASQNVYQSRSEASFALEAVMLSRLFKDPAGRWAISFVTRDDMERTGAVKYRDPYRHGSFDGGHPGRLHSAGAGGRGARKPARQGRRRGRVRPRAPHRRRRSQGRGGLHLQGNARRGPEGCAAPDRSSVR